MRGRGAAFYKDWFFLNPISHLKECDGDRCEFWRFRYPQRREHVVRVVTEQCLQRHPPSRPDPLIVASFGSGLLFQEFTHLGEASTVMYRYVPLHTVTYRYLPLHLGEASTGSVTTRSSSRRDAPTLQPLHPLHPLQQ